MKKIRKTLSTGLILSFIAAGGIYLATSTPVFAHGPGWQTMLEQKAKILKLSVEELKQKMESGLRFFEIAEQQGISHDELYKKMRIQKKERLQKMVEAGLITEKQMKERLKWMDEKHKNCQENPDQCQFKQQGFKRGFKQGFGRGFNK